MTPAAILPQDAAVITVLLGTVALLMGRSLVREWRRRR